MGSEHDSEMVQKMHDLAKYTSMSWDALDAGKHFDTECKGVEHFTVSK